MLFSEYSLKTQGVARVGRELLFVSLVIAATNRLCSFNARRSIFDKTADRA
jgi:hypothetical protein